MKQKPYRHSESTGDRDQTLEPSPAQKQELPKLTKVNNPLKPANLSTCSTSRPRSPSPNLPAPPLLALLTPLLLLAPQAPQNRNPPNADKIHKTQNKTPQNEAGRPKKRRPEDPSKPRIQQLTAVLGPPTILLRSHTFLLAGHRDQRPRLTQLLALLEATAQRFHELVDPRPPRYHEPDARLEVILFPDEAAFRRFTAKYHPNMIATDGYHSPKDRRCYTFNFQHSKTADKARKAINEQRAPLVELRQKHAAVTGDEARKLARRIAAYKKDLERYIRQQNTLLDHLTAATLIHEATHQLTAATRLIPPGTDGLPTWLIEGWPTIFEQLATHQDPAIPLGTHNPLRRKIFALPETTKLLSATRELLTNTEPPPSGAASYAQLWALLNYLLHRPHGRQQLLDFINDAVEAAREARADRATLDQHDRLAIFRRAFKINIHELDFALQQHRAELTNKKP